MSNNDESRPGAQAWSAEVLDYHLDPENGNTTSGFAELLGDFTVHHAALEPAKIDELCRHIGYWVERSVSYVEAKPVADALSAQREVLEHLAESSQVAARLLFDIPTPPRARRVISDDERRAASRHVESILDASADTPRGVEFLMFDMEQLAKLPYEAYGDRAEDLFSQWRDLQIAQMDPEIDAAFLALFASAPSIEAVSAPLVTFAMRFSEDQRRARDRYSVRYFLEHIKNSPELGGGAFVIVAARVALDAI